MQKTKKVTEPKISKKDSLKKLLKEKMPGCFYSTVRDGYDEGKVEELVSEILKI